MTQGWMFPEADVFMRHELQADGTYQRSHLDAALAHVTNFALAIDGGSHVGTWSRILSGAFVNVIAVEPALDTFDALVANMRMFGCQNVSCRQVALGAESGRGSLRLDAKEAARKNTGARYVTEGHDVAVVAIDDWHLDSLGFLKLDVEGSEPLALRGAIETLQRCKPIVLFEDKHLWRRFGESKQAPHETLQKIGYGRLQSIGCDQIWGPA